MNFLTTDPQVVTDNSISVFNMIIKGGWLMIPIFIISIISIYIFFERYNLLRNLTKNNNAFMALIEDFLLKKDFNAAKDKCKNTNSPIANIIGKGIEHIDLPSNELRACLESNSNIEINKLEKGLSTLSTSAGMAPMIGFLGTVVGMIQAFYDMSLAGSNINITLLSRGIYTAMVTTVAGLLVGIIAYFAYNTLTAKINKISSVLESVNSEFLEIVYKIKKS